MARPFLSALLCLLALPASAATTAVAVMPFRDLTGSEQAVGEAIRESVTTDLRGIAGIRVVERGEIDKVLAELQLQGSEIDQDPLATLRVGKLIGADLVTVGAYQQVGRRIRLTARFVRSQTGEVVGTAKVDGEVGEFLALQDRITVELLRSARLSPQVVERFARRAPRPKLRNFRAVELYGKAVKEKDAPMRRALLREAVKEAPAYSYAQDELAELEQRLRAHDAQLVEARAAEAKKQAARMKAAATPRERYLVAWEYAQALTAERRLHTVLRMWHDLAMELEASADPEVAALAPQARLREALLLSQLGYHDRLLKAGSEMLARYPLAPEFLPVKGSMEAVVAKRRSAEVGAEKIAHELATMRTDLKWDLCQLAYRYQSAAQQVEARRLFFACYQAGTGDPVVALKNLALLSLELGDQPAARRYFTQLEEVSPSAHQQLRSLIDYGLASDE